ncbi:LCP family protein [Candidatus Shapirobacteria bacterium]|nr:LCP family protein [Candidatus Shapirobacteria bacterium]
MFRRPIFLYLISILFAVLIVSLIFSFIYKFKIKNYKLPPTTPIVVVVPSPTPDPLAPISILLMGYGGVGHDGGSLTDSIVLANIKPKEKKITLISIPRDLWVLVDDSQVEPLYSKINYAFPFGGGQKSKEIVSRITGISPDYFFAVDFAGFSKAVDQIGGIDLKITRPFIDNFYPLDIGATDSCGKTPEEITALEATLSGDRLDQQFSCRYEQLVFDVGTTHLNGITALKYARSRHSETSGGDFNRSDRQRQVVVAIRDKFLKLGIITKIIPIYQTIVAHTQTDLGINDIQKHIFKTGEYSRYSVESISLNDKNVLTQSFTPKGQSILMPKLGVEQYSEIQAYIASSSAISR